MAEDHVTVGRIVHYVDLLGHRAAIVTQVLAGAMSLMVISPTGIHFRDTVTYDATEKAGTWHWPEREGDMTTVGRKDQ